MADATDPTPEPNVATDYATPADFRSPTGEPPPGPIVATASGEYRLKRIALVVLLFGYGLYSCYDGFYRYPRDNAAARARGLTVMPHPAYDVPFNEIFGLALPPLALLLLARSLYASRGQYRLDGDVLAVPGHPPVPLAAVTSVDRGKWDRKGIAQIDYQLPGGPAGRATLDDFLYQRQPTDWIFDRVLAAVTGPAEAATTQPDVSDPTAGPDA